MAILGHLGHIGSFWIILGHFGPFWAILRHLGPFWGIWGHLLAQERSEWLGIKVNHFIYGHCRPFGSFWVILGHFGPFWAILRHLGPFWGIWGHLLSQEQSEWLGIKLNHFIYGHCRPFGPFWGILGHFGPFWAILRHLGPIACSRTVWMVWNQTTGCPRKSVF